MNNGSRDISSTDIQKLQQQLQDIKEQVTERLISRPRLHLKKLSSCLVTSRKFYLFISILFSLEIITIIAFRIANFLFIFIFSVSNYSVTLI